MNINMTKAELAAKLRDKIREYDLIQEKYQEALKELSDLKEEYSKQIEIDKTLLEINNELESQNKGINDRNNSLVKENQFNIKAINLLRKDQEQKIKLIIDLISFTSKVLNTKSSILKNQLYLSELEIADFNNQYLLYRENMANSGVMENE